MSDVTVIKDDEPASDSIAKDVGALEANVENVEEKVEDVENQIEAVEEKVEQLEERIEWDSTQKTEIYQRLSSLDSSISQLTQAVMEIQATESEEEEDQENPTETETVIDDLTPETATETESREPETKGRRNLLSTILFGK